MRKLVDNTWRPKATVFSSFSNNQIDSVVHITAKTL